MRGRVRAGLRLIHGAAVTPWRRVWLWYWRRRRDRLVRLELDYQRLKQYQEIQDELEDIEVDLTARRALDDVVGMKQ